MNQYERRFYEDIHKLVLIQKDILKELQKMNEPLQENKEYKILTQEELDEAWERSKNE